MAAVSWTRTSRTPGPAGAVCTGPRRESIAKEALFSEATSVSSSLTPAGTLLDELAQQRGRHASPVPRVADRHRDVSDRAAAGVAHQAYHPHGLLRAFAGEGDQHEGDVVHPVDLVDEQMQHSL